MNSDTEKDRKSPESIFTEQVKELVAIGAAIASNCETCFKYHFDKARKLAVSREDLALAVETAKIVKASPAQAIALLADKYLKASDSKSSEEQRKK
jgi:AhpD family alkylhydroperoxidase